MKRMPLTILAIVTAVCLNGQELVLDKKVSPITPESSGPNLKTFSHTYIGAGFYSLPSEETGSDIRYWYSGTFHVGNRFKFKVNDFWAVGAELEYFRQDYDLKQTQDKVLPNNVLHDQERIVLDNAGIALYNRINFSRRGNIIGTFLDVGAYLNGTFSMKHIVEDDIDDPLYGSKRVITKRKKLDYLEKFQYGVKMRLGFNRFVLTGNYRLSDLVISDALQAPEPSRLAIGLELGIH